MPVISLSIVIKCLFSLLFPTRDSDSDSCCGDGQREDGEFTPVEDQPGLYYKVGVTTMLLILYSISIGTVPLVYVLVL